MLWAFAALGFSACEEEEIRVSMYFPNLLDFLIDGALIG